MARLSSYILRFKLQPVATIPVFSRSLFLSPRPLNKLQINRGFIATTSPPEPNRDLFSYSSGRFLYNEKTRLRERYVEFNINALKQALKSHVNRGNVVDLTKLAEGGFNRVLLATLEDGFKVIVKIPYRSISVPGTYATASEVATLTFLRSKDIPVPEVYGWSSTRENAVGVEYIIMEYGSGIVGLTPPKSRNVIWR